MKEFRVGGLVVVTDGNDKYVRKIDGIKRGNIKVGCCLFDWCGNEVDCYKPIYKIYPFYGNVMNDLC